MEDDISKLSFKMGKVVQKLSVLREAVFDEYIGRSADENPDEFLGSLLDNLKTIEWDINQIFLNKTEE